MGANVSDSFVAGFSRCIFEWRINRICSIETKMPIPKAENPLQSRGGRKPVRSDSGRVRAALRTECAAPLP
jgi:hypothetical protein